MDSEINAAIIRFSTNTVKTLFGRNVVYTFKVGGDDVDLRVNSAAAGGLILSCIQECGASIHPSKTYIDKYRTEFFRVTYQSRGDAIAYPCRMITALTWRKPGGVEDSLIDKKNDLFGAIDDWSKLAKRLREPISKHLYKALIAMLHYKTGRSKTVVRRWLHTPNSCGGVGFTPLCSGTGVAVDFIAKYVRVTAKDKECNFVSVVDDIIPECSNKSLIMSFVEYYSKILLSKGERQITKCRMKARHVKVDEIEYNMDTFNIFINKIVNTKSALNIRNDSRLPSNEIALGILRRMAESVGVDRTLIVMGNSGMVGEDTISKIRDLLRSFKLDTF